MEKIMVKVSTAAEMLGVKPSDVLRYRRSGWLRAAGVGPGLRIFVSSINALKEWRSLKDFKPSGYVYLARLGLYHKIGIAKDVSSRISGIQIGHPDTIELVHTIPTNDMRRAESMLHQEFAAQRVRGEWFGLQPEHIAAIRSYEALVF